MKSYVLLAHSHCALRDRCSFGLDPSLLFTVPLYTHSQVLACVNANTEACDSRHVETQNLSNYELDPTNLPLRDGCFRTTKIT